jgi:hypothetical protein
MSKKKIQLDFTEFDVACAVALMDRGIKFKLIDPCGPGGGAPIYELSAEEDVLKEYINDVEGDFGDADYLISLIEDDDSPDALNLSDIQPIVDRKIAGTDCTESESAEIKQMLRALSDLFPSEFAESYYEE